MSGKRLRIHTHYRLRPLAKRARDCARKLETVRPLIERECGEPLSRTEALKLRRMQAAFSETMGEITAVANALEQERGNLRQALGL